MQGEITQEPAELEDAGISITNETETPAPLRALHARIVRLYGHIGESGSQVSVVLMTDEEIRDLNREWRGLDEPTDVLSFPMREDEDDEIARQLPLGDIAISLETAQRYVESCSHRDRINENGPELLVAEWTLLDELTFLVIHSTLHLLGHDHAEPGEEKIMRDKEREWMAFVLGA